MGERDNAGHRVTAAVCADPSLHRKTEREDEFDESEEYREEVPVDELTALAGELAEHLAVLDPMERFVLIAYQQLERRVADAPIDLRACGQSAGLSATAISTVVRRARMANIDLTKRSLTQIDIAALLDKSDKTVSRMLKAMRKKLLESYRQAGATSIAAE
jgi:hypothetical protein